MWLAYTLHLLNMTAAQGGTIVVALYAAHVGAGPLVIAAVVSASAVPPIVLGVAAGRITDRVGFRPSMFAGSVMMAAALILAAAVPGLAAQFATVIVLGTGYLFYMVSQQSMVGALSTAETRARNFANQTLVYSLSGFLGALAAGCLIEQRGHAAAFGVLGLLPLAAGALLLVPFAARACPATRRPPGLQKPTPAGNLLRDRPLFHTVVVSGLVLGCVDLFQFYGPLHAQASGLTPSGIGAVMSAYAAAAIAVRAFMPQLITLARGEERLLVGCLILAMLACAAFPFAGGAWSLGLFAFLLGASLGCAQPLSLVMTYAISPPGRSAEALGLRFTISNGARLLLPLALGPVSTVAGLLAVFWSKAGILAGSTMLSYRLLGDRIPLQSSRTATPGSASDRTAGGAAGG